MEPPTSEVLAYSAMEEYELEEYARAIEGEYPDIRLRIERLSTAALYDRVVTEGPDGRWDVIFGWALTTMMAPELQLLFASLHLEGLQRLPEWSRGPSQRWFCPSGFVPAFCVDVEQLAALAVPTPTSWAALADPAYRGLVSMPDPRHSGAGFLHLTAMLQLSGAELTWATLAGVAANKPRIHQSAFGPCVDVGERRAAVGVTVSIAAERMKRMGYPVHMVIPEDAAGYELEGFALRAGSPRTGAARRVLEWTLTAAAHDIYRKYHKIVVADAATLAQAETTLVNVQADKARAQRGPACERWREVILG